MTKSLLIVGLLIPTVTTTRNTVDVCRTISPTTLLSDLPEASGLAVGLGPTAPLFAISDSGPPVVAVLDRSGAVVRKVTLNGARLEDWEAITAARCGSSSCLYVADIGDNGHARSSVTVYRVDEAAASRSTSVDAEAFELAYPDGPHDAESLFATKDGQLFLVTKEKERARIYRAPNPLRSGQRHTLGAATTLELPDMKGPGITDAAVSPDGKWVGVRSNDTLLLYRSSELLEGRVGAPIQIDLRPLAEPQGEGVSFGPNGIVYLVGEGGSKNRPGSFAALRCTLPE